MLDLTNREYLNKRIDETKAYINSSERQQGIDLSEGDELFTMACVLLAFELSEKTSMSEDELAQYSQQIYIAASTEEFQNSQN